MSQATLQYVNEKLEAFDERIRAAEASAHGSFAVDDAKALRLELASLRGAVESLQGESKSRRERLETAVQQEAARQVAAAMKNLPATVMQCMGPAISDIAQLEQARSRDREAHKAEMDALRAGAGAAAQAAKNAAAANVSVARDLLVGGCTAFVFGR
jgi:hypothetical protein